MIVMRNWYSPSPNTHSDEAVRVEGKEAYEREKEVMPGLGDPEWGFRTQEGLRCFGWSAVLNTIAEST